VAGVAPKAPPRCAARDPVSAVTASRADEPGSPSRTLQRLEASALCAEALNELGQRHAMLKLNEVVGHNAGSWVREAFNRPSQ